MGLTQTQLIFDSERCLTLRYNNDDPLDSTPNMALSADGQCSLVGCSKPKYRDVSNGRLHDFCGRTHANLGQSQGTGSLLHHLIMYIKLQAIL